jgi:hypothetical protein
VPHGTSVFKVVFERSMILASKCCDFGEGAITTYFNVLRLTWPARAELELKISQKLSESATTGYYTLLIESTSIPPMVKE